MERENCDTHTHARTHTRARARARAHLVKPVPEQHAGGCLSHEHADGGRQVGRHEAAHAPRQEHLFVRHRVDSRLLDLPDRETVGGRQRDRHLSGPYGDTAGREEVRRTCRARHISSSLTPSGSRPAALNCASFAQASSSCASVVKTSRMSVISLKCDSRPEYLWGGREGGKEREPLADQGPRR